MIRITAQHEPSITRLFLEGKLCGRCVDELDKCWQQNSPGETSLVVDLTNISFVDEPGRELLTRMHRKGIELFSTSIMTRCLIADIHETSRQNK
jgi:hypothetical protein